MHRKIPKQQRKFGLEVEFSTDFETMAELVSACVHPRSRIIEENHTDTTGEKWHLKTDSTTECELATPILTLKSPKYTQFLMMLDYFRERGVKVTEKDSVHIHVNASDVPKNNLLVSWIYHELRFFRAMPQHRRESTYCEPYAFRKRLRKYSNVATYLQTNPDRDRNDHHKVFNFFHWDKRGTVEIRPMEGNLNSGDVRMLVECVLDLVDYASTVDTVALMVESPHPAMESFDFTSSDVDKWFDSRISKYK